MAVKKSNTKTVKTIIPKSDHGIVTLYRGILMAEGNKNATNEQAYQIVLKERQKTAAKAKEDAAEKAKEREEQKRESAIKTVGRGFSRLADVRDLLEQMEGGDHCIGETSFDSEALATFARATLSDAATEIEQALFDLGLPTGEKWGYFVPEFPEKPEAIEAHHG
jgi:hypothetical protein